MKKIKRFAYAGAAILLSAGFAACSSEDEMVQENSERGFVKTEFNIAVPAKMGTRMSDAITQAQAQANPATAIVFRGMQNIVMIPFSKAGTITATDGRLGDQLTLATPNSNPAISTANTISTSITNRVNHSQIYKDVSVPIGTRSFLFYGEAQTANTTSSTAANKQIGGILIPSNLDASKPGAIASDANAISFNLYQISNDATDDGKAIGTSLLAYLNSIVASCDWYLEGKELHEMFIEFAKLTAGSSADVQALVQDLYTSLLPYSSSNAVAIKAAITNSSYASADTNGKLTFVTATLGDPANSDPTKAYPGSIYLPDGAAYIEYNATSHTFEAKNEVDNANINNIAKLTDYVYPASLYYRANSTISVANKEVLTNTDNENNALNASNTWDNVISSYTSTAIGGTNQGAVTAETKSIALEDQIQYAVGRLDLKVQALNSTLDDIKTAGQITASDLTVTGILIGGQKAVDFEFHPTTKSGATQYTIWDNQVQSDNAVSTSAKLMNRTLVLETADNEKIRFAIEFKNGSTKDFVTNTGLVPSGCKFYLIGEIDPTMSSSQVASGSRKQKDGENIIAAFLQDYYTTIIATISNLKNAYNVVPDLRAPELEIGLSVNLDWIEANTFTVPLQ